MWFHCNILDANVNCFEIRIFHLLLLTIPVLWWMFRVSLVTHFLNCLKENMIIENFNASPEAGDWRHLFLWFVNVFWIHLNRVWFTLRNSVVEVVAGYRFRCKGRFNTLPWFPGSVNSGSSNFPLRPLTISCFMVNTSACGKISSCWNQLVFIFSFSSFFPCDDFVDPELQIYIFWFLFTKGVQYYVDAKFE